MTKFLKWTLIVAAVLAVVALALVVVLSGDTGFLFNHGAS